jgi:hypothetical protein
VTELSYQLPAWLSTSAVEPGQFFFVCVPELGSLQWHPFSVSSVPSRRALLSAALRLVPLNEGDFEHADEECRVSHHIKDVGPGSWTGHLRRLAAGKQVQVLQTYVIHHALVLVMLAALPTQDS